MLTGLVISTTGSWYEVKILDENDPKSLMCRLPGSFRLKDLKTTNPIAVGDEVLVEIEEKLNTAVIKKVLDRKNVIIRKSTNLSRQKHIIAANVDLMLVIATPALPRTSTGFIDRLLITAEAFHVPSLIVLNKSDLFLDEAAELTEYYDEIYRLASYPVIHTSTKSKSGIHELKNIISDKTVLITGHSGVGKSSLINALDSRLNLKTGEMSSVHFKGKHTTTFAQMLFTDFGARIIDTPGIKEFGIVDFEPWELGHWFPDFKPFISQCRFTNCTHQHEPGCAVKSASDDGSIHYERYKNYLSILNNINDPD